jgi:hypothetical protein
MNTPSSMTPSGSSTSVWVKISAVLFIAVLGFLFFLLASGRQRHRLYDEVPTGGSSSGKPGQVIAH